MEGFLQSLKFKNPDMQKYICSLVGIKAKRTGSKKNWKRKGILWWRGNPINRFSYEYQELLDRAYTALSENKKFQNALLATGDANLTHSIGRTNPKETILTRNEFCSRLMKIREKLKK